MFSKNRTPALEMSFQGFELLLQGEKKQLLQQNTVIYTLSSMNTPKARLLQIGDGRGKAKHPNREHKITTKTLFQTKSSLKLLCLFCFRD